MEGGKTNFLDSIVFIFRKYLLATRYLEDLGQEGGRRRSEPRENDQLRNMRLEKHKLGYGRRQYMEVEIELSSDDIQNMKKIYGEYSHIRELLDRDFVEDPWHGVEDWRIDVLEAGMRINVSWIDGKMEELRSQAELYFVQYLKVLELHNTISAELGRDPLKLPMLYMPINRGAGGFSHFVSLVEFDDKSLKKSVDATLSSGGNPTLMLAIGRLARKMRLLQEKPTVDYKEEFYNTVGIRNISEELEYLGYEWDISCIEPMQNHYSIFLKKNGESINISELSTGERHILQYIFIIYGMNVQNAMIIIDEPELHLHPRWQKMLFRLFERLSNATGNQFILATHSPTFISPASIQYVSRVYLREQQSAIVRLNTADLPNPRHLFSITAVRSITE
jgi:putative ATP-dependent endonuclease of OLD family